MKKLEAALASHRFLEGMNSEFVADLAECSRIAEFESGQFVLRQGAPAREFYLIRSGKVSVELFSGEGGPVVLGTIEEGDVLGWSWLIPPYLWTFDARAVEATKAIAVDADVLRSTLRQFPSFGYEILERFVRVIATRLEAERLKLVGLYAAHS